MPKRRLEVCCLCLMRWWTKAWSCSPMSRSSSTHTRRKSRIQNPESRIQKNKAETAFTNVVSLFFHLPPSASCLLHRFFLSVYHYLFASYGTVEKKQEEWQIRSSCLMENGNKRALIV